jgi:hypothetical protein
MFPGLLTTFKDTTKSRFCQAFQVKEKRALRGPYVSVMMRSKAS